MNIINQANPPKHITPAPMAYEKRLQEITTAIAEWTVYASECKNYEERCRAFMVITALTEEAQLLNELINRAAAMERARRNYMGV